MSAHQASLAPPPPINWWDSEQHAPQMGWFLVDFALFAALLGFFALRPFRRVLAERRDGIERSIAEAARLHGTAVRRQAECRARLAGAQAEAAALVADSQQQGARERAQLVAQAHATEARLARDATALGEQHERRVVLRLRAEMAREIVAVASAQIRAQLDGPTRAHLVDRGIAELGRRPGALAGSAGSPP